MTKVEIMNLDKVQKFIVGLTPAQEKLLAKTNLIFMKAFRRTAKLMAPRDTGELAASIKIRKTKTKGKTQQSLLEVGAPHARPQEDGFTPHFAFIRNSSKLVPGVYFVQKNTPFIKPALEKNLSKYFQNVNDEVRRAVEI